MYHPPPQSPFNPSHTWFKLPAHSSAFIDKSIEDGDKIILPPTVLSALLARFRERLPHPLIFELNNNAVARSSHCGVLEFSSPDNKAYLPHWMMENLMLGEGRELRLRVKDLPKTLEVRLQPVEWAFTELPTPKESLEYALRKFTALTVGDTIRIGHGAGGKVYHLQVKALQPVTTNPAAGSVVNTSVSVEFEPPLEEAKKGELVEEVQLDAPVQGEVQAEAYHYYRVKPSAEQGVKVQCTASSGAPDVYASLIHAKPSLGHSEWRTSPHSPTTLTILPSDPALASTSSSPWLYLSVHAYKKAAAYQLHVSTFTPPTSSFSSSLSSSASSSSSSALSSSASSTATSASPSSASHAMPSSSGTVLGSSSLSSSSSSSLSSLASSPSPDTKLCSNCRQYIAVKQYSIHSIQCPRNNVFCEQCDHTIRRSEAATHSHCPTCNVVVHPDELAKHVDLLHSSSLQCPQCGEAGIAAEAMATHLAELCLMRLLVCHYCQMQLPAKDLDEHLAYEAARSVQCELCQANVPRKKLNNHLAAVHGINPSLRPGDRSSMGRAIPAAFIASSSSSSSSSATSAASSAVTSAVTSATPSARSSTRSSLIRGRGTEDDDISRALRQSRRDAGLPDEDADDDAVLQQVLRQSAMEAEKKGGEGEGGGGRGGGGGGGEADGDGLMSPRAMSEGLTAEEDADADDFAVDDEDLGADDWGDDGAGSVAAEEAADGAGVGAIAPAPASTPASSSLATVNGGGRRGERAMCPYCTEEFDSYDALTEHMLTCEAMED